MDILLWFILALLGVLCFSYCFSDGKKNLFLATGASNCSKFHEVNGIVQDFNQCHCTVQTNILKSMCCCFFCFFFKIQNVILVILNNCREYLVILTLKMLVNRNTAFACYSGKIRSSVT